MANKSPSRGALLFLTGARSQGASAGLASTSYLGAELLKQTAKIDIVHVPNKGAPEAVTSVMRNDSQLFFLGVNLAIELKQAGKIKIIAVSTPKRSPAMLDVPTVSESGLPTYEYDAWFAVMAPAGTPAPIKAKLEEAFNKITADPAVKKWLNDLGSDVFPGNSKMLADLLVADTKKWADYVKLAKIEPQ